MKKPTDNAILRTARVLDAIAPPARLGIIRVLGGGESCVCHLEARLGIRQAALSQHLMALRKAGLIKNRRDGRFIYYRLADPALLELIGLAARIAGVNTDLSAAVRGPMPQKCHCPNCADHPAGE
ncbi:MAG: helix-turn-helix transcriptional regulator [Anaerolineales bacterium]|nr:helix-turn-helix transcriptional regulator [Anaerolineales bacterium]